MRKVPQIVFVLAVFSACNTRPIADSQPTPLADHLAGSKLELLSEGPWLLRRSPASELRHLTGATRKSACREEMIACDMAAVGAADGATEFEAPGAAGMPSLRAGFTDDNADFAAWLDYLAEQRRRAELSDLWSDLDVSDRRMLRIVDQRGRPLPGLALRVIDEQADRVLWHGTSYGDGRVPFYPQVAGLDAANQRSYLIEVRHADQTWRERWDGRGEQFVIDCDIATSATEAMLDVVFVIDTTGSMGDEIQRIKQTLLSVTEQLRSLGREFDLRYGAVLYRDVGDAYVTKAHPFTQDLEAFDAALQQIQADGGGDGPESLNQGLAVAVDGMDWRQGSARLAFLIADAPPHMDYQGDRFYSESLRSAVAKGLRIHSVAASGLGDAGSLVFRQIAQFTRGEFVFIEYGNDLAASAADHGVARPAGSNNLDQILFSRIRDEIANWGRDSVPALADLQVDPNRGGQ